MAKFATARREFFNGTFDLTDSLVPPDANQLGVCSPGSQLREHWILSGDTVDQIIAVLNSAPEPPAGSCPADYGYPARWVFRYADGETIPIVVSASGCGFAWNGHAERSGGPLRGLIEDLHKAADDTRPTTMPISRAHLRLLGIRVSPATGKPMIAAAKAILRGVRSDLWAKPAAQLYDVTARRPHLRDRLAWIVTSARHKSPQMSDAFSTCMFDGRSIGVVDANTGKRLSFRLFGRTHCS